MSVSADRQSLLYATVHLSAVCVPCSINLLLCATLSSLVLNVFIFLKFQSQSFFAGTETEAEPPVAPSGAVHCAACVFLLL